MSKEMLEQIGAEVKGVAEGVETHKQEVEAKMSATGEQLTGINKSVEGMQEQLDSLTSAVQRSGVKGEAKERAELEIKYNSTFGNILRGTATTQDARGRVEDYKNALIEVAAKNGDDQTVMELKTLATDSLANGGVLVPVGMASDIVREQRDFSDVRGEANVVKSDTTGLIFPGEAADFGAAWVGEREERSNDDAPTFQDVEIPMSQATCKVGITDMMRLNAAYDLNSYIVNGAAEKLSRLEGAAFVNGNGLKKPKGFMTYDAGTDAGQIQQITTAASTTIDHKDLSKLKVNLRNLYRGNAKFYMNRFTEGVVETLEDDNGNPLYNRGNLAGAIENRIKGFPIGIFDDMAGADADLALTGNDLVILLADMQKFYTITDSTTSMIMFADQFTGADSGKTFYRFRKFVGGGVVNHEAGKILKVKA